MPHARTASALLVAMLALGGCGDDGGSASPPEAIRTSATEQAPPRPAWLSRSALADAQEPIVYRLPDARSRATRLPRRAFHVGKPRFLVVEETDEWVRVRLPIEPNGSTAWLPRDDVELRDNPYSVTIDTGARRLVARFRGRPFAVTRVAVGTASTPTPRGSFYVTNRVTLTDPESWYGPYALGLSAHSEALESFNGQEPQIAMHGTDHPELLGQAVSNGCIRMPNRVVRRLFARLPEGTPVTIT